MKLSYRMLGLLLGTLPLLAGAQGFQSADSIREAALSVVPDRNTDGVHAAVRVDPALRLPACSGPLQAHAAGSGIAEVACPAPRWELYVPLSIQRLQTVLVLSRPLAGGEPVTADSVRLEKRDTGRLLAGSLGDPAQAEGRVTRRPLMAGSVLAPQDLVSPRTVRRGDSVALVSRHGGMEVRAAGRALADAGRDERLRVENLSSRRIVQGVVQGNGEVLVQ